MRLLVPKTEKNPVDRGLRAICRAKTNDGKPGEIRLGRITSFAGAKGRYSSWIPREAPELDPSQTALLTVEPGADPDAMEEIFANRREVGARRVPVNRGRRRTSNSHAR